MINPNSRSLKWITEAAQKAGVRDIALVEKTIRAFSLLEALARSGCPFIFKGGSSLMLHLNTSKQTYCSCWLSKADFYTVYYHMVSLLLNLILPVLILTLNLKDTFVHELFQIVAGS